MTNNPDVTQAPSLQAGQIVDHPNMPKWGPGKILEIEESGITVYFRDAPGEPVKKLSPRYVSLDLADDQRDPQLANLPAYSGKTKKLFSQRLTIDDATSHFLKDYPQGFEDPQYIGDAESGERFYKWGAHELYGETLGEGRAEALMAEENIDQLRTLFLAVESKVNLLSPFERMAFKEAIKENEAAAGFFSSLVQLLGEKNPTQQSFDQLVSTLQELPVKKGKSTPAKWTVLTLFPYLAHPDMHMFLKPDPTRKCAQRLAFDLSYTTQLNWPTYQKLLSMSQLLLEQLTPLGARDFIDVQSFIWLVGDKGLVTTKD